MKNILSQFKVSASTLAAVLVISAMTLPALAAPSSPAPAGPVTPNFDGLNVFGTTNLGALQIDGTGALSNTTGSMYMKDSQGLFVFDDLGQNGFQVLPNGNFYQVTNNGAPVNVGNLITTVTTGSAPAITAPWTLKNGSNVSVFSIDGAGNLSNPVAGASGQLNINDPDGFVSTSQGNTTAIKGTSGGTGIVGIGNGATGVGGAFNGTVTGITANVTGASGIGVQGIGKGTSSAGVEGFNNDNVVNAIGVHGSAAVGPSGIGGSFSGTAYGVSGIGSGVSGSGGTFSNSTTNVQLATPTKAISAQGDVDVVGHIKATNGIGTYTKRTGATGGILNGATGLASIACNTGEQMLSCGGYGVPSGFMPSPSSKTDLNYAVVRTHGIGTTDYCDVALTNNSGVTLTVDAVAVCFDPNN